MSFCCALVCARSDANKQVTVTVQDVSNLRDNVDSKLSLTSNRSVDLFYFDVVLLGVQYDMQKLRSAFQAALTPMAMVLLLHLWKGFMPPLVLQAVMPLSAILSSEIGRIHLFSQAPRGELKRPFKVKSMWDNFKDLKKELQQGLKDDGKSGRKNKKAENMKKAR
jgi:hypothetical protein